MVVSVPVAAGFTPGDQLVDANQRLARTVTAAVASRCGRSLTNFTVTANEGVVTLQGRVRGYYLKQVMLTTAQAIAGVERIIDQVDVLPLEPRIVLTGTSTAETTSAA